MLVSAQFLPQPLDFANGVFHGSFIYNLTRNAGATTIASYRKTVLIYNPYAGRFRGKGEALIARALDILRDDGHDAEARPTTGPGTAGDMAREAIAGGAGLILAAGGDGTINETAEGMLFSSVPLGILPAGTANVLATEMRLGRGWDRAVRRLAECDPHQVAVGRLTTAEKTRHFLLMAGAGLDAGIVYRVNAALKARTGKFAYWVAGWSLVGRALAEFRVCADGRETTCSFALASRVRNYGGDFEIARETTLFDDTFEVVLFEGRNSARYVKYFLGMALHRLSGMPGVTVLRTKELSLSRAHTQKVYIQIDGEFAGQLPARIEIVPAALTLLIPPGYGGRKE